MSRFTKEQWRDLIDQCKSSGLSDWEWCRRNKIPSSSFYYQLNKLRKESAVNGSLIVDVGNTCIEYPHEHQEVVPLIIHDSFETEPVINKDPDQAVAARLTINNVTIDIYNHSGKDIIQNVLAAIYSL